MTRARWISLAVSAAAAEAAAAFLLGVVVVLASPAGLLASLAGPAAAPGSLAAQALALPAPVAVGVALLLHALGVLAIVRLLDGAARANGLAPLTSLGAVAAIFIPVVGPLGLGLLLRSVARHARAAVPGPPPTITPIPTLPASAPEPPAETLGAGALVARLRFARDLAVRVRAVLATRGLDGARATPLLREALHDRQEDVRLLAYALLEDRERQADATVRGLLAALAIAPASSKAALHDRLAHAYWEHCSQELIAGELEAFALGQVLEQLDAAVAAGGATASRWLLRARVLLRQGDAVGARVALDQSWRLGMPARTIEPYVAETRFVARARAVLA